MKKDKHFKNLRYYLYIFLQSGRNPFHHKYTKQRYLKFDRYFTYLYSNELFSSCFAEF